MEQSRGWLCPRRACHGACITAECHSVCCAHILSTAPFSFQAVLNCFPPQRKQYILLAFLFYSTFFQTERPQVPFSFGQNYLLCQQSTVFYHPETRQHLSLTSSCAKVFPPWSSDHCSSSFMQNQCCKQDFSISLTINDTHTRYISWCSLMPRCPRLLIS